MNSTDQLATVIALEFAQLRETLTGDLSQWSNALKVDGARPLQLSRAAAIPVPVNNTEWLRQAQTQWTTGGGNVTDITNALSLWLNGSDLPDVGLNGVNWAVRTLGAPPDGTKGVSQVYTTGLLPAS